MTLRIQGTARDLRCGTYVAYAQIPVAEYLDLVGDAFDQIEIQRKRQQHPAYARLKADLMEGALIPTITLAVEPQSVPELLPFIKRQDLDKLARALLSNHKVFILDGLQRTFIIKDLVLEGHTFKPGQTVHLEIWMETSVQNFIYRVLILNAGQKPMSARHQIKLIFLTIKNSLETEIKGLQILERGKERIRPKEYPLDCIITSYLSFFLQTPEVSDDNLTARGMIKEDLFHPAYQKIGRKFSYFKTCLAHFAEIDLLSETIYQNHNWTILPDITRLNGSETMLSTFFAAAGRIYARDENVKAVEVACSRLKTSLAMPGKEKDPLGLNSLDKALQSLMPQRQNVGYETRTTMTDGFERFFQNKGEKKLADCWQGLKGLGPS